ncbi:MAG: polyprenyl synthetase family protein [Pseudomonadales bacterium]|jgi:geranylgeranyl pyrophosphate synthase|nr:polyprenyl synthetase family protein [Pseudomonadales bacterium]MDP6827434.1 polyprenyl synthetase family protein [Pseudomonadales bacterium]MDP6971257.1 polyprenyl synthetase family protein [Pseudomonadales bacterium]|tara:strand:- start:2099 stop:2974 length:876 start_codon:yes stop_codon:yes gene_type:complete
MNAELTELKETIETALDQHLPADSPIARPLTDAMRYAALGGGKRLRPMMLCATCTALGGTLRSALTPACALEFVHAYSLVHDDLPCMDDDDLRHGHPSCHKAYGEATAVLTGDALLTTAFEVLAGAPGLTAETRVRLVQLLAAAAGWGGMVGGQHFDLMAEGGNLDLNDLQALHAAKTGALIRVAIQGGGLIAGADDGELTLLDRFAGKLGLAFQVVDDVLDVTRSSKELGKPANSDIEADKSTFVALMGINEATSFAGALLDEALDMLKSIGLEHSQLAQIAVMAVRRTF